MARWLHRIREILFPWVSSLVLHTLALVLLGWWAAVTPPTQTHGAVEVDLVILLPGVGGASHIAGEGQLFSQRRRERHDLGSLGPPSKGRLRATDGRGEEGMTGPAAILRSTAHPVQAKGTVGGTFEEAHPARAAKVSPAPIRLHEAVPAKDPLLAGVSSPGSPQPSSPSTGSSRVKVEKEEPAASVLSAPGSIVPVQIPPTTLGKSEIGEATSSHSPSTYQAAGSIGHGGSPERDATAAGGTRGLEGLPDGLKGHTVTSASVSPVAGSGEEGGNGPGEPRDSPRAGVGTRIGVGRGDGPGGGGTGWHQLLRERIERAKQYPALARRWGMEGTVEVEFRIARDGTVEALRVVKSSEFPLLDEASIETIKRAAPLPVVPGTIRVPISYRLRERQ